MNTSELAWFKSSYSGSEGDSCVEVALSVQGSGQAETIHVRDSKREQGSQLALAPGAWKSFLSYATRD